MAENNKQKIRQIMNSNFQVLGKFNIFSIRGPCPALLEKVDNLPRSNIRVFVTAVKIELLEIFAV